MKIKEIFSEKLKISCVRLVQESVKGEKNFVCADGEAAERGLLCVKEETGSRESASYL